MYLQRSSQGSMGHFHDMPNGYLQAYDIRGWKGMTHHNCKAEVLSGVPGVEDSDIMSQ